MKSNLKIFSQQQIAQSLFFICATILFIPIIVFDNDLWDGVIIGYAHLTQKTDIFHTWFFESGWYSVEWMYKGLHAIALFVGITLKKLITFTVMICTFLAALETKKIVELLSGGNKTYGNITIALALLTPTLGLFFSSIFLMHGILIYLCLLSIRLYLSGQERLGIILCILSLEHNANLVMFGSFIVLAYASQYRKFSNQKQILKDVGYLTVLLTSVILHKWSFPSSGLYANYNKPSLQNLFKQSLYSKSLVAFFYFYIPLGTGTLYYFRKKLSFFWTGTFILVILVNIIPYVLAGKYHDVNWLYSGNGWNLRFLMNLIYVFVAFSMIWLSQNVKRNRFVTMVFLTQFFWLGIHTMKYYSVQHRLLSFQQSLSLEFKNTFAELGIAEKSGLIYENKHMPFAPQTYVTQWILYRSFGEARWLVSPKTAGTPVSAYSNLAYRDKYLQTDYKENCVAELTWSATPKIDKGLLAYFFRYVLIDDRSGFTGKFTINSVQCKS